MQKKENSVFKFFFLRNIFCVLCVLCGYSFLIFWPVRFADAFFLDLWISLLWAIGMGLASRSDGQKGIWMTFFLALLPVAAGGIYYGVSFSSDESFVVAGVIPWSDAYMHFRQAAQMAFEGITTTGMNGRFLYPAYFSSLLNLTGFHLLWAEALVGVCFSMTLVMALRATASFFSASGAMVVALVCWLFFRARCSGLIMTENLGILCGLLALTLFLIATERKNLWVFLVGIFMLALGLCARPGALFVLPLLVVFTGIAAWHDWHGKFLDSISRLWKSTVVALLAVMMTVVAFGSNSLLLKTLYQGKKVIANGNFSFTLYGMLTGGKWSDAASTFHWDSQRAMQESLHLIQEKPQLLVLGFAHAYQEAISRRILFMFQHESRLATLLLLLALVGLVAIWKINPLRPCALWLTAIAIGILFSIPFVPPWDAAERPFAATVPFQALLAGIGFFVLIRWLLFKLSKKISFEKSEVHFSAMPVLVFSLLIFLLSVPVPIINKVFRKHEQWSLQQDGVMIRAGSVATLTPENSGEVHRRMASFLLHNPDQQFLFNVVTNESSLGIDWKNKNVERSIFLPGVSETMNLNSWKVDKRLISVPSEK